MKLPFFTSFNRKTQAPLQIAESVVLKRLKQVASENNLLTFQNITIYHHTLQYTIPLLIVDENRGIFLFEYKDWSFDELQDAKIKKASNQKTSQDTLAFEQSHEFINKRFNELTHSANVPIFNYLLMENLSHDDYKQLDNKFHHLLPETRVIFSDSTSKEILEKMIGDIDVLYNLPNVSNIMSVLLTQYSVLNDDEQRCFATQEQIKFIDAPLQGMTILNAPPSSGKTTTVLLKAISEKLKNKKLKIIILKPNNLASDILKKKLLNMIENAIVEIDLSSIEIITPYEFSSRSFRDIDLLVCDDSWAYSSLFLQSIKQMKAIKSLIMVQSSSIQDLNNDLRKSFKEREVIFQETNEHAKALQTIGELLKTSKANDILVVADNLTRVRLKDDLDNFIDENSILLDTTKKLLSQKLNGVILSSYDDIYQYNPKHVIMMNVSYPSVEKLKFAYNLSTLSTYVLYDTDSENLNLLRSDYENSKK